MTRGIAEVRLLRGKYRVVDASSSRVMRSVNGRALDGGGHIFEAKAERQVSHINGEY